MNTRNGSTGANPEDPTATATLTQEQPQGGESQPVEQPKDDEEQQTEGGAPDGKETPPPQAENPKPTDKAKQPAAPDTDPVKAAIDHLRSDGPKTDAAAKGQAKAQPPKGGEAKPTSGDGAEPTEDKEGEADKRPTGGDPNDPFHDWTPNERRHTKGAVKEKFRALHTTVQQMEPDAVVGREWSGLIERENLRTDIETLDDEQVAWSIRAQGAAIRAVQAVQQGRNPSQQDIATLDRLRAGLNEVDKAIGRRAPPSDPNAIAEAFTGQIPDDVKEAAELAGLSEKEARLIAALRSHKPAPTPPPAPQPAPGAAAPQPNRQPAPRAPDPREAATEAFWANRTNAELMKTPGLKPEQAADYFNQHVLPVLGEILKRDYPRENPTNAFRNLDAAARHKLVTEAITEHRSRQRPPTPPPQQPPGRTPLRAGGGSAGSPPAPADPVQAAIAHLRTD